MQLLLASCSPQPEAGTRVIHDGLPGPAAKLVFNGLGQVARPRGYRSWVHDVTSWSPIGKTPISPQPTRTPEFHDTYVEPNAYRIFMDTGRWPEDKIIVKAPDQGTSAMCVVGTAGAENIALGQPTSGHSAAKHSFLMDDRSKRDV